MVAGLDLNARFVAFEGGDGVGKTTQIARLAEYLRSAGETVVVTREPGATVLGRQIRAILLGADDDTITSHRAEALLFAADRAEHVASVVVPALESGAWVLTDRFIDSSVAYQSAGRGLHADEVRRISEWATGELLPSCVVVLDAPVSRLAERLGSKLDRMEQAGAEFHEKVRASFLAVAGSQPDRYVVIDATDSREVVAAQVVAAAARVSRRAGNDVFPTAPAPGVPRR